MWTTSTVDDILRIGDAMYLNTAFDARSRDIAVDSFKCTMKRRLTFFFLQGENSFHLTFFS